MACILGADGSLSSLCSEMVTFCIKTRIWSFHSHILVMAQMVGFEPTVRFRITCFQDKLLKPLGHICIWNAGENSPGVVAVYRRPKVRCHIGISPFVF